ncbi:MAG TPA: copper resistance protein CopC [Caulobacterales bacterium]|nr:copper resistance protein CopC [Caulobacterales bacterium]
MSLTLIKAAVVTGLLLTAAMDESSAQGVRRFTRPTAPGAPVSESQAADVTLTLTQAASRPIQTWVRVAGTPDASGQFMRVFVRGPQASLVQPGQRLRAFSIASRAQMQQGRVVSVTRKDGVAVVTAALGSPLSRDQGRYIVEIVTEAGPFMSIPNVSIVEEEGAQLVYLRQGERSYLKREIKTGVQGELYTEVKEGLKDGDEVVSVGSFFVDAETKLKSTGEMPAMAGMDHSSMVGMDRTQMAQATMPGMDHSAAASMQMTPPPQKSTNAAKLSATMSEPAAAEIVTKPVMMVHIMFDHPVDAAKSDIQIIDGTGARVSAQGPMPMGTDGKMIMAMPAKPLAPGGYQIRWKATGLDKTAVSGEYKFTVK